VRLEFHLLGNERNGSFSVTDSAKSGAGQTTAPTFVVIDPLDFLSGGMFRQDDFLANIDRHDWDRYRDKRVLVRGCGDVPVPPWAYMVITARLAGIAGSVRYGNEHDHVVVARTKRA
jgi:hypothetical protein